MFGLNIKSQIALFQKKELETNFPDITIIYGKIPTQSGKKLVNCTVNYSSDEEIFIHWNNIGSFLLKNGNTVIVDPEKTASEELISSFLMGPIWGALLHQRKHLVLHAGAVQILNGAIAFAGESGWGKSTLLSFLGKNGYPIISDDQLVFKDIESSSQILPGNAYTKLWPDTIKELGENPEDYQPVYPGIEKKLFTGVPFCTTPRELKNLYLLDFADTISIEPVPTQEAFQQIIRHTFAILVFEGSLSYNKLHFFQIISLLKKVNIYKLYRPHNFNCTTELIETLSNHLESTL
jgi:hypothetical protein